MFTYLWMCPWLCPPVFWLQSHRAGRQFRLLHSLLQGWERRGMNNRRCTLKRCRKSRGGETCHIIPMRWSLILSSTDSMSSRVRLLDPTRPFSIPNMPPKPPPFLELKSTKQKRWATVHGAQCRNKIRYPLKWNTLSPCLACCIDKHPLLFLLHLLFLVGLIVHRQQVTLHGA